MCVTHAARGCCSKPRPARPACPPSWPSPLRRLLGSKRRPPAAFPPTTSRKQECSSHRTAGCACHVMLAVLVEWATPFPHPPPSPLLPLPTPSPTSC